MIIAYIEEDVEAAKNKRLEIFNSLISASIIKINNPRSIELLTGLKFIFITKGELDRIRGLNIIAVFQNCFIDRNAKRGVIAQIRPRDLK